MKEDYCTHFPEKWITWKFKVIYIGDLCKDHDDDDDKRGGCASHKFLKDLISKRVIGALLIFIVASIACWIKYPSQMIKRI